MISRPPTTILAYHAVGAVQAANDPSGLCVAADAFAKQMEFLARHRRVISLAQAIDRRSDDGQLSVAITFDDGYRCVLEHALPVLEKYGFPATVFVPTDAIGDCNRWDIDPPTAGLEIMSPEELREAEAHGLMVESHGHRHINLATATSVSAFDDLSRSVGILTELLGRAPTFLAYPWGRVTPSVEAAAVQLGFHAAFTIGTRDRGKFARARVPVRGGDGTCRYRMKTCGYWPVLRFSRIGQPVRAAAHLIRPQRQRAPDRGAGSS